MRIHSRTTVIMFTQSINGEEFTLLLLEKVIILLTCVTCNALPPTGNNHDYLK